MKKINRIRLFINDNDKAKKVACDLEKELKKYDFIIVNDGNFELGISVGGDGSFLRMVKESNFNENVFYIGVNAGTLGFLQEIDTLECANFVRRLNDDDYKTEKISVQNIKVNSLDGEYNFKSLNEFTVRDSEYNTVKLDVYVDNELLEHFIGDGLLISTSTGSTAYNMSFGGSIVYNTLNTLSIVPIAPLNNRVYSSLQVPIIIPDKKHITIEPIMEKQKITIKVDGVNTLIDNVLKIDAVVDNDFINVIRMHDFHFIKVVNNKLINK